MTPRNQILAVALAGIAGLLGVSAALLWRHSSASSQIQLSTGTYLSPERSLPDFSLIDERGQSFRPSNLDGHWSLMFFGYTNCPDFCPTTLTTLAAMEKKLRAAGAAQRPQVVFISVDAKRDTPQQLAKYVPYFDPQFIGVTAKDQPTIEAVARQLGVAVAITPNADGSYTVDHSGAIFVVDPAGKIAAVLTGPFTADALQADFDRIVAVHG
ncbi:MAG TPA: SCO family protein [Steroidobacteraceae bacterium]|nr:SCO family protein [Steroidobacteraceae bacterium]